MGEWFGAEAFDGIEGTANGFSPEREHESYTESVL